MIKYALNCAGGCRFDAWFKDSDACDAQLASAQVICPTCGSADITKALMAPRIASKPRAASPPAEAERPANPAPAVMTAEARRRSVEEQLRALRAQVEATAEHVGSEFAGEARRIHEGDAEARAIYGEASAREVEELLEDEIPVAPLPWIDRRDD